MKKEPERPKVGVGVFVLKDGRYLLGQRKVLHGYGEWSLPGGHLEMYESWGKCAEREVWEEAGIKIKNIRFLTATNDIWGCKRDGGKHYVTIFLTSEWASGTVRNREIKKCFGWNWFGLDNFPLRLFNPLKNIIKSLEFLKIGK